MTVHWWFNKKGVIPTLMPDQTRGYPLFLLTRNMAGGTGIIPKKARSLLWQDLMFDPESRICGFLRATLLRILSSAPMIVSNDGGYLSPGRSPFYPERHRIDHIPGSVDGPGNWPGAVRSLIR